MWRRSRLVGLEVLRLLVSVSTWNVSCTSLIFAFILIRWTHVQWRVYGRRGWLVGVQFNAPLDTVEVISEAVTGGEGRSPVVRGRRMKKGRTTKGLTL